MENLNTVPWWFWLAAIAAMLMVIGVTCVSLYYEIKIYAARREAKRFADHWARFE